VHFAEPSARVRHEGACSGGPSVLVSLATEVHGAHADGASGGSSSSATLCGEARACDVHKLDASECRPARAMHEETIDAVTRTGSVLGGDYTVDQPRTRTLRRQINPRKLEDGQADRRAEQSRAEESRGEQSRAEHPSRSGEEPLCGRMLCYAMQAGRGGQGALFVVRAAGGGGLSVT
jgi:hypothetical protein